MKYGLWFCGTHCLNADWLRLVSGEIMEFDTQTEAEEERDLLYSGEEEIEVRGIENDEQTKTGIEGASEPVPA